MVLAAASGAVFQTGFPLIPFFVGFFAYELFRVQFACAKCGTPYLYAHKGAFMVPRFLGTACIKCGLSTSSSYSRSDRISEYPES